MTPSRAAPKGVSVLAAMTNAVMAKPPTAPRPTLTALGSETAAGVILAPVVRTPAAFPSDQPADAVRILLQGLEREHANLGAVISALRLAIGVPGEVARAVEQEKALAQKLIEREADRRAAEAVAGKPDPARPMAAVARAASDRSAKRQSMLEALAESGLDTVDVDAAESFAERQVRLAAEAQAAVFGAATAAAAAGGGPVEVMTAAMEAGTPFNDLPRDLPDAPEDQGWHCPEHGSFHVKRSPRRGVDFRECAQACGEFERL